MATLICALVLGPFIAGLGLCFVKPDRLRDVVVTVVTLAVWCGSVTLAIQPTPGALAGGLFERTGSQWAMLLTEAAMALYVIWVGIRSWKLLVVALMLAQTGIMAWLGFVSSSHLPEAQAFFVDKFTVIMALINGLIGGGICLYALGYMRGYHEDTHLEVTDRRPLFFAL